MTDNEIIKGLECCSRDNVKECGVCPYDEKETNTYCANYLIKDALDLINRQKAEIERLQHKNSELQHEILNCKSEAIKEFAERLKKTMDITYEKIDGSRGYQTEDYFIDNLVEEMTESGE